MANSGQLLFLAVCFLECVVLINCDPTRTVNRLQINKWKRQAAPEECSGDSYRCSNGDCIDQLLVCDGAFDCADQSDESESVCDGFKCPSYAFRCAYGACVDFRSKCDGQNDCVDKSDETLPECSKRCGAEEFDCEGEDEMCVDELLLCDGKNDCSDGSDEATALCGNMSCPSYAFRCKYGGCTDLNNVCDGKPDCVDSSDETTALCRSHTIAPPRPTAPRPTATPRPNTPKPTIATLPPTSKPIPPTAAPISNPLPITPRPRPTKTPPKAAMTCPLPPQLTHGKYLVGGCAEGDVTPLCRTVAGTAAQQSVVLLLSCDAGYAMNGNGFSLCQNGQWTPALPTCVEKAVACAALLEVSVEIACSRAGSMVNCSQPMAVGTEARLKCNPGYILAGEPNYRKIICQAGGVWDRPLFTCVPDCGKRNPNGRPFISNGEVTQIGEYPWHAGIYKQNSTGFLTQVCGGTLITPRLVISAAHCFWDEGYSRKQNKEMFKVALGKFHRDWEVIDSEMQRADVANIAVDERYRGRKRNFQYDIAILQLEKPAELTWAVNTVCVDWDNEYERFQLTAGQNGTVTGWGITEDNSPSVVLKSVVLPYVELFPTCYNTVAESFQAYLTTDKFCAGYTGNRTSVCPGDSGGGLVFQHATSRRYYLRGIVSVGSKPETAAEKCYTQQLTAFSKFSESLKWVEEYQNV